MSPAELIGECIMPRLNIDDLTDPSYQKEIVSQVREHRVGGYCVFGGTPQSVTEAVTALQQDAMRYHGTPLMFSVDCEFGLPMRLREGGTEFPDAMAIAKTGDTDNAFRVGEAIALEMRSLGLNWNFAPVADVNSNPDNPIINTRSFGSTPDVVTSFAKSYMKGSQYGSVAATAKHFPGHGDTSVDSHKQLPFVNGGIERFETLELPPFTTLIAEGVDAIMPGHLAAPGLSTALRAAAADRDLPATLSPAILTGLLRSRMGFTGVIVTDAMEMKAVTDLYGEEDASVRAMAAGVDVLLLPPNVDRAFTAITKGLVDGRIASDRLRRSVANILELKKRYVPSETSPTMQLLAELERKHEPLAMKIARDAIEMHGAPPTASSELLIVTDDREQAVSKASDFAKHVKGRFRRITVVKAGEWGDAHSITSETLIATFHRARGYLGGVEEARTVPHVMRQIAERCNSSDITPAGLVMIGSPYLDRAFVGPLAFSLRTFSECSHSIAATAHILNQRT